MIYTTQLDLIKLANNLQNINHTGTFFNLHIATDTNLIIVRFKPTKQLSIVDIQRLQANISDTLYRMFPYDCNFRYMSLPPLINFDLQLLEFHFIMTKYQIK